MQEQQLKLLLQSAIVREMEPLKSKFSFWRVEVPNTPRTLWESNHQQPDLRQLLPNVNEQVFIEADDELRALCGIGWEFVWGKPTPPFIAQHKEDLRQLSVQEKELSDLERLWLVISAVDTDYF
ncbi:MAG: hypothetical protein UX17_C0054G0008 [Parcubacteria group bacterium GW2011_GWC2_45_7]|nr:MAG: hypothetical protein UX17_C0054G0008 [Parcubacteria group bacterium GW2011_GWC2_45_7]